MPVFSRRSKARLATCHPELQRLANTAIKRIDFTVTYGHRGKEEQDEAYRTGRSKVQYPNSMHNKWPSLAMDIIPYLPGIALDWQDVERFTFLAGYVKCIADELEIPIIWGGDWDMDGVINEHRLIDRPHFQLDWKKMGINLDEYVRR